MQKIETNLAQALDAAGDAAASYDTNVKKLLADKQVLARILKYAVEEFMDMSLEDIMANIGNDIEVGTKQVAPGLSNLGQIEGSTTEDNIPGEGKIYYDIRFTAYHKKDEMKILINVEAQKSSEPKALGYHMENRIIFYMARMISAQKQTEFYHSDYDNLKKVRSIWICMDSGEFNDSIEEIKLVRNPIFGQVPEKNAGDIDLMRGIIIRIRNRKDVTESKNCLIAMLESLLAQMDAEKKKKILIEKYGMLITAEIEGRFHTMCNLSENIAERALEQGIERGIEQGIEQGTKQGRLKTISVFLAKGGSETDAKQMLDATEEEIAAAKEMMERA